MPEKNTSAADAALAPRAPTIAIPKFDAKGGFVGWAVRRRDELAAGEVHFELGARPDVPDNGTHRLKADGSGFEPIPPKPMWLPRFDAEGGLIGFDETTEDKVSPGALAHDHLPDLACDGRYRWDHNLQRYEPRPHILVKVGDTATINKMVVSGIVGLVDRETLPMAIQDQIRFIETTSPATVMTLKKKYADLAGLPLPTARAARP